VNEAAGSQNKFKHSSEKHETQISLMGREVRSNFTPRLSFNFQKQVDNIQYPTPAQFDCVFVATNLIAKLIGKFRYRW
jgi:hypothetical protein